MNKIVFFLLIYAVLFLTSCEEKVKEVEEGNYLVHVFEYVYAPGQHAALALISDTANVTGDPEENSFIYLGGFGGYFSAAFERNVNNESGDDFAVWALKGISAEPAVVWVMADVNDDGIPNETWYELKGSAYDFSQRNYQISYIRTDSGIDWSDSNGDSGTLVPGYGAVDSKAWWWPEQDSDTIILFGTLLPDVMEDTDTTQNQHWEPVSAGFTWGYAENALGEDYEPEKGYNTFDISNAVDLQGNSVILENIKFIKIQSGVFQIAGWLNEISPEIKGASEL